MPHASYRHYNSIHTSLSLNKTPIFGTAVNYKNNLHETHTRHMESLKSGHGLPSVESNWSSRTNSSRETYISKGKNFLEHPPFQLLTSIKRKDKNKKRKGCPLLMHPQSESVRGNPNFNLS